MLILDTSWIPIPLFTICPICVFLNSFSVKFTHNCKIIPFTEKQGLTGVLKHAYKKK